MSRDDLMHWSQRLPDQQSVLSTVPTVRVPPPGRAAQPRVAPPKPPRDDDAEHLLRLCRDGRLFELQEWVGEGKPLTVPDHYRRTPLRVALETGFHSLIEFLLQREDDQSTKDDVLKESCWRNQPFLMHLALHYGASISAVPFQNVIETWDREAVRLFLERGADPVANAPFARAFKGRVKSALGSFLDCKRARPDLAEALQAQADMALRQACQDDDLKWVSLLVWLGANPRSKGLTTEDLDGPEDFLDPEYYQSALQIACRSKKPEILRRLKPDPATDDLRELMAAAASAITTPETVAYLVSLGADVNDKSDCGSTVLDTCLRHFGWKETVFDRPYWTSRHTTLPAAQLGESLDALRFLLEKGARWTPDRRAIADVRRALYRVEGEAIVTVIELLRTHRACGEDVLGALRRAPKMRGILAAAAERQAKSRRAAEPTVRRGVPRRDPSTSPRRSFPRSRYDRQRLYNEVWTEPTQKVAQRYGVSDVAIAKACAFLDIPKPPRGYWAKKAAGHALPTRPPLPSHDP